MKVNPFGLPLDVIRGELDTLRTDMSIAVVRAKNPFNIGAIIRVAHSFLVREIFLIGTEPFYEKAAMGMQKYENIVECPDENSFLERVNGRPIIGIERDHATGPLWTTELPHNLVFLFGSEDFGIPEPLIARCTSVASIPMYGINHSFPLTVAVGITLAEWAKRRDPTGTGDLKRPE
ncbi:MAG: TrmH family RNA methyltransferase [Polyangiaceae bacterium]|nr:TrmH family RNA methyltransferase [Polyangiaceae bacterium]